MKAWSCMNYGGDACGYIVFAETRGKARAMVAQMDGFECCEWNDPCVEVKRLREADGKRDCACVVGWGEDSRLYYEAGWWPEDGAPQCDCCARYQYDDIAESVVEETDSGDECKACRHTEASKGGGETKGAGE